MFEDGLGEIQWPSKPDLPQIKKPGLHLFRTLNSVEPAVSSSIAANAAGPLNTVSRTSGRKEDSRLFFTLHFPST